MAKAGQMSGLFDWAQHLPPGGLYAFIFAWLFVESTGFPISDEPLLLLAGYLAHTGRLDLVVVAGVALVGKVSASCLAYWIGHHVNLLRLARPKLRPAAGLGHWLYPLRPTEPFLLAAERRAQHQGPWGVFVGRLIPVVRSFISYPAGAARMPFNLFLLATTAGSLIWITTWTLLGAALGKSYEAAVQRWGTLSWLVLAAFVIALAALWLWSHRRAARAAHAIHATEESPPARMP
jgi:membrane protein DedA with SNARE-associated domain